MAYAFDEFYELLNSIHSDDLNPESNSTVRYLCSLVSELAYYSVTRFDIDSRRRVQVIPCVHYPDVIAGRTDNSVEQYLEGLDLGHFLVEERGIVAVGVIAKKTLFIGFRGTAFLYDWRVNLQASLLQFSPHLGGRLHRGFFEETVRIVPKLINRMREQDCQGIDRLFLTGHSLGGAVAAITARLVGFEARSALCTFGSPRFSDVHMQLSPPFVWSPQAHVQASGDIVPFVPPRWMGYADNPSVIGTSGESDSPHRWGSTWLYVVWRLGLFLGRRLRNHSVECYRKQVGSAAGAAQCGEPLFPMGTLGPRKPK